MARSDSRFIRSRYLVFAGTLLITLCGAFLILRDFAIDNSVGIWFAQDDPALVEYERYLEEFGHSEWTLLMVETASLEAPGFLRDLRGLTARLARLNHVRRVVSLVNVPGSSGPPGDLIRRLEQSPFARNLLLRPGDRRHTVLLLQTANYLTRKDPYRLALVDEIHAAVAKYPSITDHGIAGTSVINAELNRSARTDMFVFFTLVTLLVFVISLVLFRSLGDAFVLLAVAASTVVFSMGLIAAFGYRLNMVTIMLPTVLIALSVADAIHVIYTFHQIRLTDGAGQAVGRTIRQVWLPCLGTSVTTIVGFMSLSGSTVLPIFQLAVFGSCGIAMALVLSLTVAPLMLFHFWQGEGHNTRRQAGESRCFKTLVSWLHRQPATIALVFVVTSGGVAGLWLLEADTNYAEFFRSGSVVPRDYAKIDSAGFPQNPLVLTLKAPATASRLGGGFWVSLQTFGEQLRRLHEVRYVMSPVAAGLSSAPSRPDPLELVSRDRRQCRLILLTNYLGSNDLHRLMETVRRLKEGTISTGAALTITGTTVLWASMDTQIIRTQVYSAFVVSAALLLVLTLIFRSFSLAVVGWLVSTVPVALILGVMGIVGVRINMATVLIAGIALGIAVDDTIHLIFSFRDQLRSGCEPRAAMEQAMFEIGPRLVITSVILIGGFGSMVISSFLPTANFGFFSCLTILVALLYDLLFLPLVLRLWGRARPARKARRFRTLSSHAATTPFAIETRRS